MVDLFQEKRIDLLFLRASSQKMFIEIGIEFARIDNIPRYKGAYLIEFDGVVCKMVKTIPRNGASLAFPWNNCGIVDNKVFKISQNGNLLVGVPAVFPGLLGWFGLTVNINYWFLCFNK